MPTWLWIMIAVVVVLGLLNLALRPGKRRDRDLDAPPADQT